ncbi:peptidylprolyl isomerase [Motilimonas eburnea]|uniref:peptidylprolyl isomerase n=1 Tax=Motilimonas eburnea TaxID=1737488 RepID=UPI001E58755A|nr:peptidylprolyl isomerase [Motilimonas eburnea]MCE2572820.1 peptidylprolyl isomerase [Motilimonas eburnea]
MKQNGLLNKGLSVSLSIGLTLGLSLMLVACGGQNANTQAPPQQAKATPAPQTSAQEVIASVNGQHIYVDEFEYALNKLGADLVEPTEQLQKKVLDSLIVSRVMANEAKAAMSEADLAELALAVKSYQEELLVKRYLKAHLSVTPVSEQALQTYYQENLPLFGQDWKKEFLLIKAKPQQHGSKQLLAATVKKIAESDDWQAYANQYAEQVSFQHAEVRVSLLPKQLAELLQATEVGQSHFSQDGLTVVKVLKQTEIPAKAYPLVKEEIRTRLAPMATRDALKQLTSQILAEVVVER